ncbi:MAG: hypothetical protein NZ898_04840, partial [Myxococcota bacterium]|nr:hypothetical protein [Myxococcota bacterium]
GDVERPPRGDDEPPQEQGDSSSDHAAVIGRFGVGWCGVTEVPIGGPVDENLVERAVPAPSVGIRYWLSEGLGLDIGLGIGFQTFTLEVDGDEMARGSGWAFALHGGLPLALHHAKHYKFLFIPELTLGLSGASAPSEMAPDNDDLFNGFLLRVGGRAGAEIHFGFIDVPELSIEGSVGLALEVANRGGNFCGDPDCDATFDASASTVGISTFLSEEPWDMFTGNIRARYYF